MRSFNTALEPIKDEESAQVETLELAECPWRRNQTRAVEIPGLFSQNQRQHGVRPLPMRDNTAPSQLVHRAPKIPPPTASTVNGTPTKEMAGLAIRDRTPPKAVAKIASGVTVPPVKPEEPTWGITGIGLDQCDFYFQPPESDKPVVYPYLGYCMVYPIAEDFSVRFVAKFAVELHLETAAEPNTALLHLETDGLESRVHDVSRMAAPRMSMDGTKCILRNEASSESEFSYRIGLKDQETTTLFVEAIEGLQKALRAVVEHQETAVVETTTVTPAPALETPPQSLVNLEPEPDTLGAIVGDAINAIRKNDNRSPQVKRHRHTSSDGQAFDDLSEAMFTDWKERAAIPNTPFMRDSFRDLLCVLMRIDHILEHPGAQDQPVMSEATLLLKSLEDKTNEGSKTIRYSADDMMHLRGNAVDRAEELSKKHFLPQKTPDVLTPKAGPQTIFRGIYTPSSIVNLQSGPSAHVQGEFWHPVSIPQVSESLTSHHRVIRLGEW